MDHADPDSLVAHGALGYRPGRITLTGFRRARHRVEHGVIGQRELEVRAVDDVDPVGQHSPELVVRGPDRLRDERIMIAREKEDGAVLPVPLLQSQRDLLPPLRSRSDAPGGNATITDIGGPAARAAATADVTSGWTR